MLGLCDTMLNNGAVASCGAFVPIQVNKSWTVAAERQFNRYLHLPERHVGTVHCMSRIRRYAPANSATESGRPYDSRCRQAAPASQLFIVLASTMPACWNARLPRENT